jgi:hypothetical protein
MRTKLSGFRNCLTVVAFCLILAPIGPRVAFAQDQSLAEAYRIISSQYGTHIDPPAHFDPSGMTVDLRPARKSPGRTPSTLASADAEARSRSRPHG